MGLDVSHDAYSGSYTSFHYLRLEVCAAAGVVCRDDFLYFDSIDDGLEIFLTHSDCDGEISPQDCKKVADSLRAILPKITEEWQPRVLQFIHGAEKAALNGESLEFS